MDSSSTGGLRTISEVAPTSGARGARNGQRRPESEMQVTRKTILIMDDDPANIRLFHAVLWPLGATLIDAENGAT